MECIEKYLEQCGDCSQYCEIDRYIAFLPLSYWEICRDAIDNAFGVS